MINYGYDLISGKVNYVGYQSGKLDEMHHRYNYDAENRLTEVFTANRKPFVGNRNVEEKEATYNYYKHGPLARTELGANKVQALDYAYTLQGWLKGVNSTALNPTFDMGGDGLGATSAVARDVMAFSLNYYMGDYKPINSPPVTPFAEAGAFIGATNYKALYNGNIAYMSTGIKELSNQLYNYRYDQLNRLVQMDAYKGFDNATNLWNGLTAADAFGESISYDGNGNITTYNRDGDKTASKPMDRMAYSYVAGTNKLNYVDDAVPASAYSLDVDAQTAGNFEYDAIGNLTKDIKEGIIGIEWTAYGKIKRINKADNTIEYTYDASGNRISKTVGSITTWYVRDAQGNTLGTYEINGSDIQGREGYLYGSSRLGAFNRNLSVNSSLIIVPTVISGIGNTYLDNQQRGQRQYELSNHLGNVLATISDKKIWNSTLNSFEADLTSASDYYPFGMLMPGRHFGQPENVAGMEYVHTTEVNGQIVPTDMSLSSRSGSEPVEYVASSTVEVQNGFESGSTDEFTIYIADESYAGTGNQVNGGGLNATTGKYRYGFNGKENDNEVKGVGNQQDYGMRIYDPRVGRFLSLDPISKSYPELTPYQFASNTPIQAIDLDGLEAVKVEVTGRTTLLIVTVAVGVSVVAAPNGISVYLTPEGGLGAGISAGAGVSLQYYPSVKNSEQFNGWGFNVGASAMGWGADISGSIQQNSKTEKVEDVLYGGGGATPKMGAGAGAEGHLSLGYSFLIGTVNWTDLKDKLKELAGDAGIEQKELQDIANKAKIYLDEQNNKQKSSTPMQVKDNPKKPIESKKILNKSTTDTNSKKSAPVKTNNKNR